MRSVKLLLKNIPESLGLVLVARYKNESNPVLAKLQTVITFALAVRLGHIAYGFGVEK